MLVDRGKVVVDKDSLPNCLHRFRRLLFLSGFGTAADIVGDFGQTICSFTGSGIWAGGRSSVAIPIAIRRRVWTGRVGSGPSEAPPRGTTPARCRQDQAEGAARCQTDRRGPPAPSLPAIDVRVGGRRSGWWGSRPSVVVSFGDHHCRQRRQLLLVVKIQIFQWMKTSFCASLWRALPLGPGCQCSTPLSIGAFDERSGRDDTPRRPPSFSRIMTKLMAG